MKPNNDSDYQAKMNGKPHKQNWSRGFGLVKKIKTFSEQHPKQTLVAMMLFALLNFGVMLYLTGRRGAKPFLPSILDSGKKTIPLQQKNGSTGPAFSLGNYMQIARLKDSLDMLMAKKTLTHADTLMALRIFEAYSRLDPSFLPQVTNALKQKGKPQ